MTNTITLTMLQFAVALFWAGIAGACILPVLWFSQSFYQRIRHEREKAGMVFVAAAFTVGILCIVGSIVYASWFLAGRLSGL